LNRIRVNCKTLQCIRTGLGRYFYGHRLQDEPLRIRRIPRIIGLGDTRSDTDSDMSVANSDAGSDRDGRSEARLEAYGPRHLLSSFCIVEHPKAGDLCTVCQESFDPGQLFHHRRCVFTDVCWHVFHAECINKWVNGTAPNRDRCPECRGQIVEWKRAVRPEGQD
jgi:hypothetical protein